MSGLPKRARGRQTAMAEALYEADLCQFCNRILEIRSRLDFEVGSRGWCYLLETDGIVTKGEFDEAERLITRCRKRGDLPLDICSEDSKRAADGIERLDDPDVEAEAQETVAYLKTVHQYYTPYSFLAGSRLLRRDCR